MWLFFCCACLCKERLASEDACSSRTTPKPRPPTPTPRPNITFHTYKCPPAYAAWYCLNDATCFTVKIGDSLLYNCDDTPIDVTPDYGDEGDDETRKGCCRFTATTTSAAQRPFTRTVSLLLVLNSMTIQGRKEQAENDEKNVEI